MEGCLTSVALAAEISHKSLWFFEKIDVVLEGEGVWPVQIVKDLVYNKMTTKINTH